MSAFEIITKEEFEDSGVGHIGSTAISVPPTPEYPLTWCDFCKGYYIEEFHFGRRDDTGNSDSNEA